MDSNPTCAKRMCIRDTDPGPGTSNCKPKDENQHIQVFVRVRPMNNHEKSNNAHTVLDCPGTKEVVVKERSQRTPSNMTKTFTFDRVFGPNSKQIEIYKSVVAPLLEEVLLGYNCTVFAYGQTGTGKTYTMEGDRQYDGTLSWDKDPLSGVVPRALNQLFDQLRMQKVEFTVRVSLLELYNEELFDLLASTDNMKPKNLRLYEDNSRKGSVVIQGLEEVTVHDKREVYSIMEKGAMKRQTATTLMNEKSSRSHTVFTVTVHIKESNLDGEELLKIGKLHLVDLAGSENIGRSGAVDKRAREAGSINQSLLTLGRVITALVERTPHVPYRESKLTRILQDSLGGRTKTSIIATVSPASINIEETLSTLDYAHRAKNITNRPEINQKLTKKAILKAYTEEIEQLKKDLVATREKNGIFLDKGNYDRMVNQLDAQGQDISERIALIKSLEETVEKKEEELESTKAILTEKEDLLEAANQIIHNLKLELSNTKNELRRTRLQRDEKHHLMSKHMETENKLSSEASQLLETANATTLCLEKLYSKLERKRRIEDSNLNSGKLFRGGLTGLLMSTLENFAAFRTEHSKLSGEQRLDLESFLNSKTTQFDQLKQTVMTVAEQATSGLANITKLLKKHVCDTNTWTEAANNAVDLQKQSIVTHCETMLGDLSSTQDLLSNLVTEMCKTHQAFVDETLQFAKDAETKYGTSMRDFNHAMALVWRSLDQYTTVQDQNIVLLQQEISHLKSVEDSHQHGFEIEMKRLEESFQTIKDGQKRFHKCFEENSNSIKTKVGNIHQEEQQLLTNLQDDLEITKSHFNLSKTNACQTFEGFRSKISNGNKDFVSLTSNVQNAVIKQRDDGNNGLKTIQEMHSEFAEALKLRHQSLDKEESLQIGILKKDTSDIASRLSLKAMKLEEQVQMGLNSERMMVEKLKEDILQECNWASNWTEIQSSQTSEQLRILSEYFESTYRVDLPSGTTPQRKAYEYPQKLTVTSPHESLLSRFREQTSSHFRDVSTEIEEEVDETTNPRADSLNEMVVVPIADGNSDEVQIVNLVKEEIPNRTDVGDETEQSSSCNSEL